MSTEPSVRAPQSAARSGPASSTAASSAQKKTPNTSTEGASFLLALQSADAQAEPSDALMGLADADDKRLRSDESLPPWAAWGQVPTELPRDEPAPTSALGAGQQALGLPQQPLGNRSAAEPGSALAPGASGAGKSAAGKPGWTTLAAQRMAQTPNTQTRASDAQKAEAAAGPFGASADSTRADGAGALGAWLAHSLSGVQAALAGGPLGHAGAGAAATTKAAAAEGAGLDDGPLGLFDAASSSPATGGARSRDANASGGGRDNPATAGAGWQVEMGGADLSAKAGTEAFGEALMHNADVEHMAEQVSLWVASGVKEAELQIDRLGQGPVEVSISMDGARADIVFRSDEAGARDALNQSMAQLQALMQQEGLTLGSMSVASQGKPSSDGAPHRGPGAALRLEKNAPHASGLPDALDRALDRALSGRGGSSARPGGVDVFV